MRLPAALLILLPLLGTAPAHAAWHAANAEVTQAAKNPRIAEALEATNRMEKAILSHDVKGFADAFAQDAVVNNPFNKIARKADAENNLKTGLIDYTTLVRSIEYAAVRGQHDIVLMGEEKLTPVGKARFAGKTVHRRTTEVWTDESGEWKLAIRQATIYATE
jgi:hypothetical protein